jgi:hypothetical protein
VREERGGGEKESQLPVRILRSCLARFVQPYLLVVVLESGPAFHLSHLE